VILNSLNSPLFLVFHFQKARKPSTISAQFLVPPFPPPFKLLFLLFQGFSLLSLPTHFRLQLPALSFLTKHLKKKKKEAKKKSKKKRENNLLKEIKQRTLISLKIDCSKKAPTLVGSTIFAISPRPSAFLASILFGHQKGRFRTRTRSSSFLLSVRGHRCVMELI
jgi:hypothetical protein